MNKKGSIEIMIGIMICAIIIVLIVDCSGGYTCQQNCHKNPDWLIYANISGHGIDHVCYDLCVGGATEK